MSIFCIFSLYWYFDVFCEICAYLSLKRQQNFEVKNLEHSRCPAVRCNTHSDSWSLATAEPVAVRSGESCAETKNTPSDCSKSFRSYGIIHSNRCNTVLRPLTKRQRLRIIAQRPLAKMQRPAAKTRRTNLIYFLPKIYQT